VRWCVCALVYTLYVCVFTCVQEREYSNSINYTYNYYGTTTSKP
jgi:hypothetical protein